MQHAATTADLLVQNSCRVAENTAHTAVQQAEIEKVGLAVLHAHDSCTAHAAAAAAGLANPPAGT